MLEERRLTLCITAEVCLTESQVCKPAPDLLGCDDQVETEEEFVDALEQAQQHTEGYCPHRPV